MNSSDIKITPIAKSKISTVDFNNITFGRVFSDHMFECEYANGKWSNPTIKPYQPITLEPSARVFHYGQAVFEGMKAYKDDNGDVFLFRPEDNFNRINKSAERLAMPKFSKDYFMNGLKELIKIDKDWVKPGIGNALYIRPFMIASEGAISASPASEYKFMIICSPVSSYFSSDEVKVVIAEKYSRSANGGVGFAKAAGNYAGQFYPQKLAKNKGFQQVIWTDANTHEYIEEAGTMNVFFRIGNKIITGPVSDRILDGITRKSLIKLMEDNGFDIEIRPVRVDEVKDAAKKGELKEIFGSGTAVVISPIFGFEHQNESFNIPKIENSYASQLKEKLINIQYNKCKDDYGWRVKI